MANHEGVRKDRVTNGSIRKNCFKVYHYSQSPKKEPPTARSPKNAEAPDKKGKTAKDDKTGNKPEKGGKDKKADIEETEVPMEQEKEDDLITEEMNDGESSTLSFIDNN